MIDLEDRLAERLQRRASDVRVVDDLDAVLAGDLRIESATARPSGRRARVVLAAAAVLAVAGIGTALVVDRRNDPVTVVGSVPEADTASRVKRFPLVDAEALGRTASAELRPADPYAWEGLLAPRDERPVDPERLVLVRTVPADVEAPAISDGSAPGRQPGTVELSSSSGPIALRWAGGNGFDVVAFGGDLDVLYELVDNAAVSGADGRFEFVGDLPSELAVSDPPSRSQTEPIPVVNLDDGTSVEVHWASLDTVTATVPAFEAADIPNWKNTRALTSPDWTVVLASAQWFTVAAASATSTVDDLLTLVTDNVDLVDEATWREHYGLEPATSLDGESWVPAASGNLPLIDTRLLAENEAASIRRGNPDDQISTAVVGVDAAPVPTNLVSITRFGPQGQQPEPEGSPGRVAGVSELRLEDSAWRLTWSLGDAVFTSVGRNLDEMYAASTAVEPADGAAGFSIGDLADGVTVLQAPTPSMIDGTSAYVQVGEGVLEVDVNGEPPLSRVANEGELSSITMHGRQGYAIDDGDRAIISVRISPAETLTVGTTKLGLDALRQIAESMTFTSDETAWRAYYENPASGES